MNEVSALPPHWLDEVIESVLATNSPAQIAQAIAKDERLLTAIEKGLKSKPQPGIMGPSHAQIVRSSLQDVMA